MDSSAINANQDNVNYFRRSDYNYYKDAFGEPNVVILRGATDNPDTGKESIRVMTTDEVLSSEIHVSDIKIGENITLSSTTPLRLDDTAGPSAFTFGELEGEIRNLTISLFGQNVTPFCSQPPDGRATVCEVTLNPDGHLVVKSDAESGYLNFTTTSSRTDLASQQVALARPDTSYTVMGYWMDEEVISMI